MGKHNGKSRVTGIRVGQALAAKLKQVRPAASAEAGTPPRRPAADCWGPRMGRMLLSLAVLAWPLGVLHSSLLPGLPHFPAGSAASHRAAALSY
jgi:hypothetical protein